MRPRLHHDPVLEEDVGRPQYVLPLLDVEGDVVEPAARARLVQRVDELVRLRIGRQPDADLGAVVEQDLLRQPHAQVPLGEGAVLGGIDRKEVDVIEMTHADAAPGEAHRLVFEGGPELGGWLVALGLVEQLEPMAVGIEELVRPAVAEVTVEPLTPHPCRLE